MAFIEVYTGSRATLVNTDFVSRVESRGSRTELYMGEAVILVTASLAELKAHLGNVATVGAPAVLKAKPEYEGAPDFGIGGPPDYIPPSEDGK
jgi:hypothetical protein